MAAHAALARIAPDQVPLWSVSALSILERNIVVRQNFDRTARPHALQQPKEPPPDRVREPAPELAALLLAAPRVMFDLALASISDLFTAGPPRFAAHFAMRAAFDVDFVFLVSALVLRIVIIWRSKLPIVVTVAPRIIVPWHRGSLSVQGIHSAVNRVGGRYQRGLCRASSDHRRDAQNHNPDNR